MQEAQKVASGMDAPIALRKGKRRSSVLSSPQKPGADTVDAEVHPTSTVATPARRRKRVRFSDSALPSNTTTISTGITPHLRRASLGTPRERRLATPSHTRFTADIDFTPFKQVLDDRVKRRIRRNGMSEEMNEYEGEKKTKATLQNEIENKDAELKRLRAELDDVRNKAQAVNQIYNAPAASQERLDEVEAELEALRQSFALEDSEPVSSWDHIPISKEGPSSDGGDTIRIYEDDDDIEPANNTSTDADSLVIGLELEAARHAKQSFLGSFRESTSLPTIEFADSPARRSTKDAGQIPATPRTFYHFLSKQLKATTNRAEEVELALKSLEDEISGLGFSPESNTGAQAIAAIADHFRQARLELEHALPGETVIAFENAKILPELVKKLKHLSEQLYQKGNDLRAARDQQHNLKGNFEKAIVAAEKATARVKNLEAAIDASAEEMLNLRIRSQRLEKDLTEREKDVDALTTALKKYRSDVARLENLISQLEADHATSTQSKDQAISDLDAQVAAEQRGRRAAESSAITRLSKISELESALGLARDHACTVESTIASLQAQITSTATSQAEEVGSLNARISNLSTALASANAEVEKLKITKSKLEERVRMEIEQGAQAVEAIQMNLIKSVAKTNENKKHYIRGAKVRIANWQLSDDLESDPILPLTPASTVQFAEFSEEIVMGSDRDDGDDHIPGSVEVSRGKKQSGRRPFGIMKPRRRYDSGIGMSPVGELEMEDVLETGQDFASPELESEMSDFDVGVDDCRKVEMIS